MDAEFITLDSRLIIKKGIIQQKNLKFDSEEGLNRSLAFIAILLFIGYSIYEIVEEQKYYYFIQIFLCLFWLAPHVKRIYKKLFVQTWKSTIKLNEITNVITRPFNELETEVILQLKNGREKNYVFRNAENQIDSFLESVGVLNSVSRFPR